MFIFAYKTQTVVIQNISRSRVFCEFEVPLLGDNKDLTSVQTDVRASKKKSCTYGVIKKGRPDSSILKDLCMDNVEKLFDLATLIVAKWYQTKYYLYYKNSI